MIGEVNKLGLFGWQTAQACEDACHYFQVIAHKNIIKLPTSL